MSNAWTEYAEKLNKANTGSGGNSNFKWLNKDETVVFTVPVKELKMDTTDNIFRESKDKYGNTIYLVPAYILQVRKENEVVTPNEDWVKKVVFMVLKRSVFSDFFKIIMNGHMASETSDDDDFAENNPILHTPDAEKIFALAYSREGHDQQSTKYSLKVSAQLKDKHFEALNNAENLDTYSLDEALEAWEKMNAESVDEQKDEPVVDEPDEF